jgi:hypothetical protein
LTVTVKAAVAALPLVSAAEHVTRVVPSLNRPPGQGLHADGVPGGIAAGDVLDRAAA